MLRAARLLLQRRTALGAATAAIGGHARRPQVGSMPVMTLAPAALGVMRSCLFATKAAREQGEGDERRDSSGGTAGGGGGGGGGGASSKGKRTLKQRLKEVGVSLCVERICAPSIDSIQHPPLHQLYQYIHPTPNRRPSTRGCISTWSGSGSVPTARAARPRASGGGSSGWRWTWIR